MGKVTQSITVRLGTPTTINFCSTFDHFCIFCKLQDILKYCPFYLFLLLSSRRFESASYMMCRA